MTERSIVQQQPELPLISVYMPTYNRVDMVQRAISSVLAQDYPHLELLVVDDASSDLTWDTLNRVYADEPRVRLFRQDKGQGACAARNLAIAEAKGEFVTGLDDDDEFLPNRLSSLYQAYDDQYAFVCSSYFWDYGTIRKQLYPEAAVVGLNELLDVHCLSNQVLVKRSRILAQGGFDIGLSAFQDYDMWIRLVAAYGKALRLAEATYVVHVGHELGRITTSPKRLAAQSYFVEKHLPLMNERNKQNQQFYRLVMEQKQLSFGHLLFFCRYGLLSTKIRYYLKQKVQWAIKFRQQLLSKGLKGLFSKK